MSRKRIHVYTVKCRRGCGKTLATTSRSIWGISESIRKKYQGICEDCMTESEKKELFAASISAVRRTINEG